MSITTERLEMLAEGGDLSARGAWLRALSRQEDWGRFGEVWREGVDATWRRQMATEFPRAMEILAPGMCWIPPGTFEMGSPPGDIERFRDEAAHCVTLTRAIWMDRAPLTQARWSEQMGRAVSRYPGQSRPTDNISWYDAVAWCNARSKHEGLPPAYHLSDRVGVPGAHGFQATVRFMGLDCPGYRLPTEAEWEWAARAQRLLAKTIDAHVERLDAEAWYEGNQRGATRDVMTRAANPWGLHDALGNVWEWCWDEYASYPSQPITDPVVSGGGHGDRVARGGCWISSVKECHPATRGHWPPTVRRLRSGRESFGARMVRSEKKL